eukprot:evm.model.scf_3316.1 EVM.evm.TU.scf_3316.1   scf_3316:4034-4453(-)
MEGHQRVAGKHKVPPLVAEPLPHFVKEAALFDRPQKRRRLNTPVEEADLVLFMQSAKTPDAAHAQGSTVVTSAACTSPTCNHITVSRECLTCECTLPLISTVPSEWRPQIWHRGRGLHRLYTVFRCRYTPAPHRRHPMA